MTIRGHITARVQCPRMRGCRLPPRCHQTPVTGRGLAFAGAIEGFLAPSQPVILTRNDQPRSGP